MQVFEVNTSDQRDGKHLLAQLQEATQSHQLPRTALAPSGDSQQSTAQPLTGDEPLTTLCLEKSSYLLTLCNFVKSYPIFKIFALLKSVWNLLQNPYDITHLTLGTLLHYLGKLNI